MNACFCLKDDFDLRVQVVDSKTIIYNDLSYWMEEEPYIVPDKHSVIMVMPNDREVEVKVTPKSSTILRAEDLQIDKFLDGIYTFRVDALDENSGACGIEYQRYAGIYPNLDQCLKSSLLEVDDDKVEELYKAKIWRDRSEIAAECNMQKESLDYYSVSKRILEKINCGCPQKCKSHSK